MIGVLAPLGAGGRLHRMRRRGFSIGVAAGAGLPVALLLAFSFIPRDTAREDSVSPVLAQQRRDFLAFEEALKPVRTAGASAVVYGMRPGIDDIYGQRFDDETLVTMAKGWVEGMKAVRDDYAEIEAPLFLAEAHRLYRDAFDAYVDTARALLGAARAGGDQRAELIVEAGEHGTRADGLYDVAKAALDRQRTSLGLQDAQRSG